MCEPPLTIDHIAVRINNCILMTGGKAGGKEVTRKPMSCHVIWAYNIYTEHWRKHLIPAHKKAPPPNERACAVVLGEDVYMFGGLYLSVNETSGDNGTYTNALWKLSGTSQECFNWTEIEFQTDVKLPSPRGRHCGWEYAKLCVGIWRLWAIFY